RRTQGSHRVCQRENRQLQGDTPPGTRRGDPQDAFRQDSTPATEGAGAAAAAEVGDRPECRLPERAGVSARGISDLERGLRRRAPSRDTVSRLAVARQLSTREQALFAAAARRHTVPVPFLPGRPLPPHHGSAPSPFVGRERELLQVERYLTGQGPPVL